MDYSLPGSPVHGILQARMLECHFLLQGNLSDSGIKPKSPALQVNSLPSEPPGKPSLGFSLTHKRGRESCCNIPNILLTLRVHPIFGKFLQPVYILSIAKDPHSRWLLPPGAICETLKMGRKETGVEGFRWKTHGSASSWGEGLLDQAGPFPGHV